MRNEEIVFTKEKEGNTSDDSVSHKIKNDAEQLATFLYCLYKEKQESYNNRGQNS